ncbi:sigma-70 family RNA polymerase sigma factor [Micromonospora chersina]|uniref:sigma-70 family RNA polymerase sigma factor n=1 Tax=Micromonospora chersina TaxID=47854 RepID=UPI0033DA0EE0
MEATQVSLVDRCVRLLTTFSQGGTVTPQQVDGVVDLSTDRPEALRDAVVERLSLLGITLAADGPDDNESGMASIYPHPSGRVPAEVAAQCVTHGRAVLRRDRAQRRPWDRVLTAKEEVGLAVLMRGDEFAYDKDLPRGYRAQLGEHDERAHAFDALVLHNLRLVASVGKGFLGQGLDMQDVDQHGVIGLMRAVERFDVTRGLKFSTYATWWIRQAVSRGIANEARLIRVPVHKAEQIRKVKSAQALLISRDGHAALRDLVAMTGLAAPVVLECLRLSVGIVSLDLLVGEDHETRLSDFVLLADDETGPESLLGQDELRDIVHAALAQLPERSAAVLALRAGIGCDEPMTLDEVGRVFGVTRERIRQIEGKARNRLRETLTGQLDRW